MADATDIEWTDATWNPVTGCSVVSPGCTNCYAMKLAGTRLRHHPSRAGLTTMTKAGPVWNGQVRFNAEWLDQPLRWTRPRRIFVCAHGDLFHEDVPDDWIDQVFAVMALSPQHTFQVLTKRSARMRQYLSRRRAGILARRLIDDYLIANDGRVAVKARKADRWPVQSLGADLLNPDDVTMAQWPLPNVWLGVSAEDQARADERIPDLIVTPAAVRFVSLEPLLGPIDLTDLPAPKVTEDDDDAMGWRFDALSSGEYYWFECGDGITDGGDGPWRDALDLVIVGGENGDRPMHPDWPRQIREACATAGLEGEGVPFFFKQWGSFSEFEAGQPNRIVEVGSDEAEMILEFLPGKAAWVHADGRVWCNPDDLPDNTPARLMVNVGKKAAGRLLDGVEHNALGD